MAVPDFGVTAALVAAESGMGAATFGASSIPTSTQVDVWIGEEAAYWSGLLRSLRLDPASVDSDTTTEVYAMSKRYVTLAVAVRVARIREVDGNSAFVSSLRNERDAIRQAMLDRPANLGDGQPTGDAAPNLTRSPRSAETDATRASYRQSIFDNPNRRL